MKKVKRFLFGIISSALFAVGLVRAADRFDPVMPNGAVVDIALTKSAPQCTSECNFDPSVR